MSRPVTVQENWPISGRPVTAGSGSNGLKLVANLATAGEVLVAKRTILVALATVSVAISSPANSIFNLVTLRLYEGNINKKPNF